MQDGRADEARVYQGALSITCIPTDASQEIGWTHMRILEGVGTLVQLAAMIARLCRFSVKKEDLQI